MASAQGTATVNLQRALIIGLGGTGAEVLVRTRRLLINFFGGLENIPIVRFLYLDTDLGWWGEQLTGVEEQARLSEIEFVNLSFDDASSLYRGIEQGNYPHYRWFSFERLRSRTRITNGAGAVRQYGRLCFWHHYSDIRRRAEEIFGDLVRDAHAQFMTNKYQATVQPGLNVYIVAGLAGGTGSGIFLDVAYLMRKLMDERNIIGEVNAYLVLPQAFRDLVGNRGLANGYAALKELNLYHYIFSPIGRHAPLYGQPVWDVQYTQQETDRIRYQSQRPFDYCYLLDTRNAYINVDRVDILGMIARALFHEFTLSFAAFKRSLRTNIGMNLNSNDWLDCPMTFMSFGQSSVLIPRSEIRRVFAHQLALRGVQQWIDKNAAPVRVYDQQEGTSDSATLVEETLVSIREEAKRQDVVNAVRTMLIRDLIPRTGLGASSVITEIVREHQERLTDIPYSLREGEKEQWLAEKWDYQEFVGRVTDAWERWRTDFSDEGADRMKWGEQIRKLEANKGRAFERYVGDLQGRAHDMFENTQQYGPAWALCAVQQLQSALQQLKDTFIKEANDPVAIANVLGDVYLINAAARGQGPSLSAIIEARIGQELEKLRNAVDSIWPFNKRERVERAAHDYLTWCAHWCRARVEERARRLAAELAEQLVRALQDLEREMLDHAAALAELQGKMLALARSWNEKARRTENIGVLLYNPQLLDVLEAKVRQRQGDMYDPVLVGQRALERLGKGLRELRRDEVDRLLSLLLQEAERAVGDLDDAALADTQFSAHDLLSALHGDDNQLQEALRDVYEKSDPYVRLDDRTEDGGWEKGAHLLRAEAVGIRGGGQQQNDPDPEHARIVGALKSIGIDVVNNVQPLEDSSQIVFFQECGGFPLRALPELRNMKEVYEQHRTSGGAPLHIERDEMAERFPDPFPPEPNVLERALVMRAVGVPLGVFATHTFRDASGSGAVQKYAVVTEDRELRRTRYIPVSETLDGVAMQLAYRPELLELVERAVTERIGASGPAGKSEMYEALLAYLQQLAEQLRPEAERIGVDPEDLPAYQEEENRIRKFIAEHGLAG